VIFPEVAFWLFTLVELSDTFKLVSMEKGWGAGAGATHVRSGKVITKISPSVRTGIGAGTRV